ncbi:sugar hydrolase, partial [Streptomyces sp. MBT98]|uniref:beta-1,3-glucanase family protein n=1 Tax=Streptomyces sp. MBT98 TaxID=2800412 RepID=UPI001A296A07|nr:sugar hydrolase [Streptomyces sp. MBT98]
MPALRRSLGALTAALALALGLTTGLGHTPAEAAVPATIPLTIKNDSGRADQIYVYNLGTELSTGRQGWADANGTFHPWPAGGELRSEVVD